MKNFCINYLLEESRQRIKIALDECFKGQIPVVACIGTDAVVGDSLGPLTGSMIRQKLGGKTFVFGTVDSPITAKDVGATSDFLKNAYPETPVLAIDAALGKKSEIGNVKLFQGALKPGLGVDKKLKEIGTVSLIGVVEQKDGGKSLLSSVRLSLVYNLATVLSDAFCLYVKESLERKTRYAPSFAVNF
ncbi:MAG: spore protease YyaC [Clostridia bacterium]|nr:spore protease YyaC [Clostridia bacterium]